MMKLRVKTLGGWSFWVNVKLDDTVAEVKQAIEIETIKRANVYPAAHLIVVHSGRILEDNTTLQESGVTMKSFLVIFKSPKLASESNKAPTAAAILPVACVSSTGINVTPLNLFSQDRQSSCTGGPNVTPLDLFPQDRPRRILHVPSIMTIVTVLKRGRKCTSLMKKPPRRHRRAPVARSKKPTSTGPNRRPQNHFPHDRPRNTPGARATDSGNNEPAEGIQGNFDQLTFSEQLSIYRLMVMGFSFEDAVEAFNACDKDEDRAADYLRDHSKQN